MKSCINCKSVRIEFYKKLIKSVYSDEISYDIVSCGDCGILQTHPQPSKALLNDIYSKKYRYDLHEIFTKEKIFRARKIARLIHPISGSSLLELGSGNGALAKEFSKKYAAQITAVDLVQNSQMENVRFINSDIVEFLRSNREQFQYIVISHTLEHMLDIPFVSSEIVKILKPSGSLIVIVPNAVNRNSYWGYWQVPVHTVHFSSKSLENLFSQHNMVVSSIHYASIDSLGFLATIANILGTNGKSFNLRLSFLLKMFSFLFRRLYRYGNSDLIMIFEKK
jgi:SAM-dependent methyltransferase